MHPLRSCDAAVIGLIGVADRAPLPADDRHIQQGIEAFARFVERVLERDNAVAVLDRDRSQLQAIIASAMDAIVSVDAAQCILRFNGAAEHMFQRSAHAVVGQPLDLLIPARFRQNHRELVQNFSRIGVSMRSAGSLGEVRGMRADGTEFPAEVAISRVRAESGSEYTAIIRDITEHKAALDSITQAEARFRSLVEQKLVGIFIVQGQRFRYLNPYLAQMLGCESSDEILDRIALAELIVPAQRSHVTTVMRECLTGKRSQVLEQFRVLRRDGQVIEVELHGQTFPFEGRPAIIGVVLDITERSRTEMALRQSEELFRSMFETMSEAVVVHDFVYQDGCVVDYTYVDVNPAFEQHTGIPAGVVRGRRAGELLQDRHPGASAPFLDHYRPLAGGVTPLVFEAYLEPLHRRQTDRAPLRTGVPAPFAGARGGARLRPRIPAAGIHRLNAPAKWKRRSCLRCAAATKAGFNPSSPLSAI